jgi:hypothetical protein
MKKMKNFMVVHRDPQVSWQKVENNWSKMASVEPATWLRTYYNKEEKVRYCLWLAPNKESLKDIFGDFQVSWESILEVEETLPDIWARKYRAETEAEERADSATSSEILAKEGTV